MLDSGKQPTKGHTCDRVRSNVSYKVMPFCMLPSPVFIRQYLKPMSILTLITRANMPVLTSLFYIRSGALGV